MTQHHIQHSVISFVSLITVLGVHWKARYIDRSSFVYFYFLMVLRICWQSSSLNPQDWTWFGNFLHICLSCAYSDIWKPKGQIWITFQAQKMSLDIHQDISLCNIRTDYCSVCMHIMDAIHKLSVLLHRLISETNLLPTTKSYSLSLKVHSHMEMWSRGQNTD